MKLRIPSLLKSDKTKATLKQFLLSLLATTFSIALTFGTSWLTGTKENGLSRGGLKALMIWWSL